MLEFTSSNIRMWSRLGSCGAFGVAALEMGENIDNLAMITADLCFYSGLDRFQKQYPEKMYNVGIAEQNLLGVAAGMAKEGLNVFATTYGTFASARCTDQVRVNMGYMQLPIKLVGVTSGLSTGILGATHITIEDLAILRSVPNITILSPADTTETVKATIAAAACNGPVYLRLTGKMGSPVVYKEDYSFEIGKAIKVREGSDVAIIATGPMVAESIKAAEILEQQGISCTIYDMHTIKPIDEEVIRECLGYKLIVTAEEHNVIGGLGSAVAEILVQEKNRVRQLIIGIEDEFKHAAEYDYLLKEYQLTGENIAEKIQKEMRKN